MKINWDFSSTRREEKKARENRKTVKRKREHGRRGKRTQRKRVQRILVKTRSDIVRIFPLESVIKRCHWTNNRKGHRRKSGNIPGKHENEDRRACVR